MDTTSEPSPSSDTSGGISSADSQKNLVKNTVSNLVFVVFNTATTMVMVPFLIAHLGIANYGMVTLANSFVAYNEVFTAAIFNTVFRFASIHIAKREYKQAQGYVNTQLVFIAWFVAILIPVATLLSFLTPHFINIPSGQDRNTQLLFFAVYIGFCVLLISSPFRLGTYVKQRFDVSNGIEMLNQVSRYSTWIVLFTFSTAVMWKVGIGYILGSSVFLLGNYLAFRKYVPAIKLRLGGFEKKKFLDMTNTGIWMTIGQLGAVLYIGIDLLIVNLTLGPEAAGFYSPILQLSLALRGVGSMMAGLLLPITLSCFATQDWDKLIRNTCVAMKFISLGMAIPVGIACGLGKPFLVAWLGPKFGAVSPLIWVMLVHQIFNAGVEPLFGVNLAANKVAVPGVATVAGGVLKVALSVGLALYTPLGLYGVALGTLVSFVIKNLIFIPYYGGVVLKTSSKPFYGAFLPSALMFVASSGMALAASRYVRIDSLLKLLVVGLALGIVCAVASYVVLCNKDDKALISQALAKRGGSST